LLKVSKWEVKEKRRGLNPFRGVKENKRGSLKFPGYMGKKTSAREEEKGIVSSAFRPRW